MQTFNYLNKLVLFILLFSSACSGRKAANDGPLTFVVRADSVFAYTGKLADGSHFKRLTSDSITLDNYLRATKDEYGKKLTGSDQAGR